MHINSSIKTKDEIKCYMYTTFYFGGFNEGGRDFNSLIICSFYFLVIRFVSCIELKSFKRSFPLLPFYFSTNFINSRFQTDPFSSLTLRLPSCYNPFVQGLLRILRRSPITTQTITISPPLLLLYSFVFCPFT